MGYKFNANESLPSFDKVKAEVLRGIKVTILGMVSAALASFLDPLESVTRYPDQPHAVFDENNAYIKNFIGLHDVIACILVKTREAGYASTSTADGQSFLFFGS